MSINRRAGLTMPNPLQHKNENHRKNLLFNDFSFSAPRALSNHAVGRKNTSVSDQSGGVIQIVKTLKNIGSKKMNRLVLIAFLGLVAVVSAQWGSNNQNYPQFPNQQPFPNQPPFPNQQPFPAINDLCNQPGANCKTQSRFAEESSVTNERGDTTKYTRVCDDRGCYDRKVQNPSSSYGVRNGSSAVAVNTVLLTVCAALIGRKIYVN